MRDPAGKVDLVIVWDSTAARFFFKALMSSRGNGWFSSQALKTRLFRFNFVSKASQLASQLPTEITVIFESWSLFLQYVRVPCTYYPLLAVVRVNFSFIPTYRFLPSCYLRSKFLFSFNWLVLSRTRHDRIFSLYSDFINYIQVFF